MHFPVISNVNGTRRSTFPSWKFAQDGTGTLARLVRSRDVSRPARSPETLMLRSRCFFVQVESTFHDINFTSSRERAAPTLHLPLLSTLLARCLQHTLSPHVSSSPQPTASKLNFQHNLMSTPQPTNVRLTTKGDTDLRGAAERYFLRIHRGLVCRSSSSHSNHQLRAGAAML